MGPEWSLCYQLVETDGFGLLKGTDLTKGTSCLTAALRLHAVGVSL